ncbi:NAD-dependent epimerase/dehydratase family protein [Psychrobacillus psychrodurans]|uniref:NAD(P)-dependent oxidoreductase n=1 Tax=Psychrobacillus psychrodurans TaxID=126157 RepID=A0A9X3L5Y0_9BACI|nr:NAD(P)-dependent oxidoreductase [Psychrobacillus psychrodurans]MCZ8532013.1 NAD(P)-dependent oxidoreductase [Psychrobacillus psychrodurans]
MKKVIITGANGFIGSSLTNYLSAKGIKVFAIVKNVHSNIGRLNKNKNIEIIYSGMDEILKLNELIPDRDIDVFYHFAWSGVSDSNRINYHSQTDNIKYTCHCVEASNNLGCKTFIFASSLWEYECYKTMSELEPVGLSSLYSSAKIAANFMARTLCNNLEINYMAAIITNIYGIGETSPRLINSTIRKLLNKEETQFTSSTQTYDFIYIDDAVKAFYYIGLKGVNNKSYYIGSAEPMPLKNFLNILKNCVDKEIELGIGKIAQKGIHLDYKMFDLNAVKVDTGFEPEISFETGINKTIEWLKNQKE